MNWLEFSPSWLIQDIVLILQMAIQSLRGILANADSEGREDHGLPTLEITSGY